MAGSGDKAPIIVIKKKKGAHAGAHGGAWKVAYADFVTAMMAFFLVMWLLGSDDETKQAISHYFNTATPWRPELSDQKTIPLGQRTGSGDDVLSGATGQVPAELVQAPQDVEKQSLEDGDEGLADTAKELVENKFPKLQVNVEHLRFSLPEDLLFRTGSDELSDAGHAQLKEISVMLKRFRGKLVIKGATEPQPRIQDALTDPYEFTLTRTVAAMNYLVSSGAVDQDRVTTAVHTQNSGVRSPASGGGSRKLEFILER